MAELGVQIFAIVQLGCGVLLGLVIGYLAAQVLAYRVRLAQTPETAQCVPDEPTAGVDGDDDGDEMSLAVVMLHHRADQNSSMELMDDIGRVIQASGSNATSEQRLAFLGDIRERLVDVFDDSWAVLDSMYEEFRGTNSDMYINDDDDDDDDDDDGESVGESIVRALEEANATVRAEREPATPTEAEERMLLSPNARRLLRSVQVDEPEVADYDQDTLAAVSTVGGPAESDDDDEDTSTEVPVFRAESPAAAAEREIETLRSMWRTFRTPDELDSWRLRYLRACSEHPTVDAMSQEQLMPNVSPDSREGVLLDQLMVRPTTPANPQEEPDPPNPNAPEAVEHRVFASNMIEELRRAWDAGSNEVCSRNWRRLYLEWIGRDTRLMSIPLAQLIPTVRFGSLDHFRLSDLMSPYGTSSYDRPQPPDDESTDGVPVRRNNAIGLLRRLFYEAGTAQDLADWRSQFIRISQVHRSLFNGPADVVQQVALPQVILNLLRDLLMPEGESLYDYFEEGSGEASTVVTTHHLVNFWSELRLSMAGRLQWRAIYLNHVDECRNLRVAVFSAMVRPTLPNDPVYRMLIDLTKPRGLSSYDRSLESEPSGPMTESRVLLRSEVSSVTKAAEPEGGPRGPKTG